MSMAALPNMSALTWVEIQNGIKDYSIKGLVVLLLLVVGWRLTGLIHHMMVASFKRMGVDPTLQGFLDSLTQIVLKILLVLLAASVLGIGMTSIIAVVGAASLAVGLSLQGSLSNFAGGVLILALRPFKVGDYIETATHAGTVTEIRIFYTYLCTADNRRAVIPNGILSNNALINHTSNSIRRMDLKFYLSPQTDLVRVKEVAFSVIDAESRILKDPHPFAGMVSEGPMAMVFDVRVWCETEKYWDIYFELMEKMKVAFQEAGIETGLLSTNALYNAK